MSFGFSPSDFLTLFNLTRKAYKGWKDACGEYSDITSTLFSLQVVLKRVRRNLERPDAGNGGSFLQDPGTLRDDLAEVLWNSNRTVGELRAILKKYRSLGRNRKSNWERLRLGCEQLDGLQIRLSRDLNLISTILLDQVLLSIDLCRQDVHRISSKLQGGVPVALENIVDNQGIEVWRSLRREMVNMGFKSDDVLANKDELLALARVITGNSSQQVQEKSTTATNPPMAFPKNCPNESESSAGNASQTHLGATEPYSSGPLKLREIPDVSANVIFSCTGHVSERKEIQQSLNDPGDMESCPNRTSPPDQPARHGLTSDLEGSDDRDGFPPRESSASYAADLDDRLFARVPTDSHSVSLEPSPPTPIQPSLPLLGYEPISLQEEFYIRIHLCLPRGWQIHIDQFLKVTFKDLHATSGEPIYLELPPMIHRESVHTPPGWTTHSSHGRLSWSRTNDEGPNSVFYWHPTFHRAILENWKPMYRCIQKDRGRHVHDAIHSLRSDTRCSSLYNGFLTKNCQGLTWTQELQSSNPELIQRLRMWTAMSDG
ncbi:hypothetical protein PMIN06_004748 [Paraphaeosphaeria minitans]